MLNDLIQKRKQLHAHPELSGQEKQTATNVLNWLKEIKGFKIYSNIGGHGIVARFDSGKKGPCVLFRSELDALPIKEINSFPHQSIYPGIAHKCGHDGHMTILLGLARQIRSKGLSFGQVLLLFQPAEENGSGARAMLADPQFEQFQPDYIFALHNLPGHPLNKLVIRAGSMTAAVKSMVIQLKGRTAHAAEPHLGINPAKAVAELILALDKIAHPQEAHPEFSVITIVHIQLGEKAYGVSAGYGELHLTIRSWTNEAMNKLDALIQKEVKELARKHQLESNISYTDSFPANINNPEAVGLIQAAAKHHGFELIEKKYPLKWGEDFGLFTKKFSGAFFGLGAGENIPPLHAPNYDFPDELIPGGIQVFTGILEELGMIK